MQVRRGDGVVVLHKTATRGPSGLVVECVLPVGEFAVEVRRQDRITHRGEIAVSRALQDRNAFAVPPVR